MFDINQKLDSSRAKLMNPVILAYIGDAVFSLYTREKLVFSGDMKVGDVHKIASGEVSAIRQADLAEAILPILSEDEADIYRRARNAKKSKHAKNATVAEYNMSTGFEAVLGYLYITGRTDRLNALLDKAISEEIQ